MLRVTFRAWTAAFSERGDGDLRVSSRAVGEPLAAVQARVLDALGVSGIAVGLQVNGAEIVVVGAPVTGYAVGVGEGDGVVTALPGVAMGVHVADCLPIAVGGAGGVAMLHGGWRGLAAGIVATGVSALRDVGVRGALEAAIGPGVGGCCYETGDEGRAALSAYRASRGRLLDLKAVAAAQLREAGVSTVQDLALCTICAPPGLLYSHRRDGPRTGRQGGFAWLR